MGVEELGAMLVETYRHAYGETDPARTLSALRLNGMREIVADIDALATGLVEWCHFAPDEIITARRACAPFAPGYGMHTIDLAHFCSEIMAVTSNPSLKMLATTLAARIKASVIDNHSGAERQGPFGSTGMAIYFPETRALFNTDPDHIGYDEANPVYPLEFVQRHKWGTFLRAYYLRVL